jgi:hypothetical protein
MFAQRETPTIIKTAMENVLDECDAIASQIATDLDAIPMTVWAEEVRIGSPPNFHLWVVDVVSDADANYTYIQMSEEDGTPMVGVHTYLDADVVELVSPSNSENAQEVEVENIVGGAPADPQTFGFYCDTMPGGVDSLYSNNTEDRTMKLILRERTP